ncbi:metallophosphoesterase family protein [Ferroacidibacillus organovorans]|uniref:Phosphoesterase n=1 Tax=Ferroacidibacillus organovorans TaxID=1765683 RepID=A0A853K7R7_9BACL|nr:metallophosphoesterase family protein [Ferroacidibacillus organovorans]KYP79814.1 phosphoesterase [Ferroacidibacillus organovorans]OAG92855.1 phosphoesterase [Ferroacidibacillus organovorans]
MTTDVIRTVVAIYDIHGNLPALNAVLKELKNVQPDHILVGGDIVSGPMPRETLDRFSSLNLPVHFIRGNGDREVVTAFDGKSLPETMSEEGRRVTEWAAEQLARSQRDFLAQLPERMTLQVEGLGDVLFCHATPHSDEEIFTPISTSEYISRIFAGVEELFVVCGHTHMQFERQVKGLRILNAGSVGMPYAEQPGAYWMLIGPDGFEFRRTTYDLETAARDIEASGYPQAQEFVKENVLAIPTATEAAQFLEGLIKRHRTDE